jgi:large repetitive protein
MRRSAAPLFALLSLGLAAPAGTQTPLGPEFRANEFTIDIQARPAVATDAAGNFVVAWHSFDQDGDSTGIMARRYDAAGNPRGPEFQVNTYTTNGQFNPEVAHAPDGSFVVVWTSYGQDGSTQGVFGRRFDAAGSPASAEFQVNTDTTNYQAKGRVAFAPDGGFVVVWESAAGDGDSFGVFGQRFDAAANPVGTQFQVNSYTTGYQYSPAVAGDGSGGFVVVWESYGQDSGGPDLGIFGQRFDAGGHPVGAEFLVNSTTAGYQFLPSVAADRDGSFTVAWSSDDNDLSGIWARRFDAAAVPAGSEFPVNTTAAGNQIEPVLAMDGGNLTAVWESSGQDGSDFGIAARRFDCQGQPLGDDFVVNAFTTGYQARPVVAAAGGDFVVAWQSRDQDGSEDGVFGRRFRGLPGCGARFHAIAPCRLADTRLPDGPSGGPSLPANTSRDFPVGGSCGIPADARAVAVNVTTVGQTEAGNLRLYPAGAPAPLASAINFAALRPRANSALVRAGLSGRVAVRCDMAAGSTGRTHVVLDAFGYFR